MAAFKVKFHGISKSLSQPYISMAVPGKLRQRKLSPVEIKTHIECNSLEDVLPTLEKYYTNITGLKIK